MDFVEMWNGKVKIKKPIIKIAIFLIIGFVFCLKHLFDFQDKFVLSFCDDCWV